MEPKVSEEETMGFEKPQEPKPKKATYIDEDLRAKFFAKEESKSEKNSDDDW